MAHDGRAVRSRNLRHGPSAGATAVSEATPARWTVGADTHAGFVVLSGDTNPLHTDPLAARRLPFGRVTVHGVHLVLDTLERLAATTDGVPSRVSATFRQPVGVGDVVTTEFETDDLVATARLSVDRRVVADLRVDLRRPQRSADETSLGDAQLAPLTPGRAAAEHRLDDLVGRSGSVPLQGDRAAIAERFPRLVRRLTGVTVAEFLAATRLIGMEVPGLHSLLSSFDCTIDTPRAPLRTSLDYRVDTVDERFSRVEITIDGPTVHGRATAFVRPSPVDQIIDTSIVTPDEFVGVRALVVGGSRGLGAAAVQLLAAGGADVRFTYRYGADDAARVTAASGATAFALDAAGGAARVAEGLAAITHDGWMPRHLAWFASPPIFVGGRDTYSDTLFEHFRRVYVDTFVDVIEQLDPERLEGVLWPSSEAVAVDITGLAEYADAKRLGEHACRELAAAHPNLIVDVTRFPRLRTDQTASIVPIEADDPAPHVLAALRHFAAGHV